MKPRKGSHSVYSIHLHLVLVTKYRKKIITSDMMRVMSEVFQRICKAKKSTMLEFDGESDHCHLLIDLHPDNNISQLVASLKSASSRILRKEFAEEINKVYWKPVFWSGSYYIASSGGVTIERLRKYIEQQDSPNAGAAAGAARRSEGTAAHGFAEAHRKECLLGKAQRSSSRQPSAGESA